MSADKPFTKENLDDYLKALGKEFRKLIDDTFSESDYERLYYEIRKDEIEAKEILLEFDKANPGELKGDSIDKILEQARQKKNEKN